MGFCRHITFEARQLKSWWNTNAVAPQHKRGGWRKRRSQGRRPTYAEQDQPVQNHNGNNGGCSHGIQFVYPKHTGSIFATFGTGPRHKDARLVALLSLDNLSRSGGRGAGRSRIGWPHERSLSCDSCRAFYSNPRRCRQINVNTDPALPYLYCFVPQ